MSFTKLLDDPDSPLRAYLDGASPRIAGIQRQGIGARSVADALGLTTLAGAPALVPARPGLPNQLVGTAFDFRARIALGGFDPTDSAAAIGRILLPAYVDSVKNGAHRAAVLSGAFDVAQRLLVNPRDHTDFDRASVVLGYLEPVYRVGAKGLIGSVGDACDRAADGQEFVDAIDPSVVFEIGSLEAAGRHQLTAWREQITAGKRFAPNPSFPGAALVGGADADWLVGETLIDCKVYGSLSVPKLRDFLRQLLGYVLLDLNDELHIRSIGVWLPRQGLTPTWSLEELLSGDPDELLPSLREGLSRALKGSALATSVPITERRRHQLLAENRHTPFVMLTELVRSADPDIRFRVGRNVVTPEQSVRILAHDRLARVREGVARNEAAPADVLAVLENDSSVGVRRAVASNPGAPVSAVPSAIGSAWGGGVTATAQQAVVRDECAASIDVVPRRSDEALDFAWLYDVVAKLASGGRTTDNLTAFDDRAWRLSLPAPSQVWAFRQGRSVCIPAALRYGLPPEITTDLLRHDRPPYLRMLAAGSLPVDDEAILRMLLEDPDPDIRLRTLERTCIVLPDTASGAHVRVLLSEMAASRDRRMIFLGGGDAVRGSQINAAERDRVILELIAGHPLTAPESLASIIDEASPKALTALLVNGSLPASSRAAVEERMQTTRFVEAREWFAMSSATPAAVLDALASDRLTAVRLDVALNPSASADTLRRLGRDRSPDVRRAVVDNPSTLSADALDIARTMLGRSKEDNLQESIATISRREDLSSLSGMVEAALDRLSRGRTEDRVFAAGHPRTAGATILRLSKSTSAAVRQACAENVKAPSAALKRLTSDVEEDVRLAIAQHLRAPLASLDLLARDDDARVRASAAINENTPAELLTMLLADDDQRVRDAAAETSSKEPPEAERARADRPQPASLTPEQIHQMAASKHAKVRMDAAYSPAATPDVLAFLGGERRSVQVRRVVAANPKTPPEVLASLASEADADVLKSIGFNEGTPVDTLRNLANRSLDLALLVSLNPAAPNSLLEELGGDPDPLVRYVAQTVSHTRGAVTDGSDFDIDRQPLGPA